MTQLFQNQTNDTANTIETFYSNEGDSSITITAFVGSNSSGVNHSYKAYIYDASGVTVAPIQPIKFITSNRGFHISSAMIGQEVPVGGSIRIESSNTSLSFSAVGI